MTTTPDLVYTIDSPVVRFVPNTDSGVDAWRSMAEQDESGNACCLIHQLPGVLLQLAEAGYVARERLPYGGRWAKGFTNTDADLLDQLQA